MMPNEQKLRCVVDGVYQPRRTDRMFYYTGESAELYGDSIEKIVDLYNAVQFEEGTVKNSPQIFCRDEVVGVISPLGIMPAFDNWLVSIGIAVDVALKNARALDVEQDVIERIQGGNIHEIVFFTDPRVGEWLTQDDKE